MSGFVPRPMDRRPASPRRVRSGIRLRSKEGLSPKSWIARQWLATLESMLDDEAAPQGLEYAQLGQVAALSIELGAVEASVQGRAPRPYAAPASRPPTSWRPDG